MKKYLTIVLMLIISCVTFVGCANIEFIRAVDATNTIVDKLVIELDRSKIEKSGADYDTVVNTITGDMQFFRNKVENWKEQFIDYPEIYTKIKEKGYIFVTHTPLVNNKLTLSIEFNGWDMFGLFYGYSEIENFEYQKVMEDVGPFIKGILNEEYTQENYGLFLIKYSIIKSCGIENLAEDFTFGTEEYYEKYRDLTNSRYSTNDITFSQIFAFPDDRLYSNADDKEVQGGLTMLRWDFSDKDENYEMIIYKLAPKTVAWYILALVLATIFVVIITIYFHKKAKNQVEVRITKQQVENDGGDE